MTKLQVSLFIAASVFGGAIGGGCASWFLVSNTIECQKLIVKNKNGKVVIGADQSGPLILMKDRSGKLRIGLIVDSALGTVVEVTDDKEIPRVALGIMKGLTGFSIFNNQNTIAALREMNGVSSLSLATDDGTIRSLLNCRSYDSSLTFYDKDEHLTAVLGSSYLHNSSKLSSKANAISAITLFDKEGKVLGKLPSD